MAINVGSVYLSTYIDSKGLERGISNVQVSSRAAFSLIGGMMTKAFEVKPVLDNMARSVYFGISQTATNIGPVIDSMGNKIAVKAIMAMGSIGNIAQYINNVFSKQWDKAWTAVGEGFKGVWYGVANFFTGIINAMINGINAVLSGLNKINIKMPEWLGNGSFGFNLPLLNNIPYMAKGGVVSQPTLAMIGERGKEAVMPLENNTAWITDLANQLGAVISANAAMRASSSSGGIGGIVNLYVDGKKLAEATIDDFSRVSNRRGIKVTGI